MVLGKTYKDPDTDRYLMPNEVEILKKEDGSEIPRIIQTDKVANMVWEKMSKSKFNGVDPDTIISRYGADVTRLASLFMAPPEQALEWDEGAVSGQSRWCERLRRLTLSVIQDEQQEHENDKEPTNRSKDAGAAEIVASINTCATSVTECFETASSFNVAIAQLMKLSNVLNSENATLYPIERRQGLKSLLVMLTPFAPHLASELYEQLQRNEGKDGKDGKDGKEGEPAMAWPNIDITGYQKKDITVVFQISGKKKIIVDVPSAIGSSKTKLMQYIEDDNELWGKLNIMDRDLIQKTIVVPSKDGGKRPSIVNFVLKGGKKKKKKKEIKEVNSNRKFS